MNAVISKVVTSEMTLRDRVRTYKGRIADIDQFLSKHPREWGRFQKDLEFDFEQQGVIQYVLARK